MFNQLQTITDAKRQILTSPFTFPTEEYQASRIKLLTASPKSHVRHFLPEKDQSCHLNKHPSETKQTLKWACRIMSKTEDNTSQVAVSYSVMWRTKPPRLAVMQEAWKKAKSAQISKAAEQVQAWQQALCSSWPLENIGKGIMQGKKLKLKTNSTRLDCLYPTIL